MPSLQDASNRILFRKERKGTLFNPLRLKSLQNYKTKTEKSSIPKIDQNLFCSPTSSSLYHRSKASRLRTRTCQAPCCRQTHHTGADDNHSRRTLLALAPPCAQGTNASFLQKSLDTLHNLPVPRPSRHKQPLVNM